MTLEEAIIHAEAVAKTKEREAKENRNHGGWAYDDKAAKCSACAAEHRQLAEWLRKLQKIKEIYDNWNVDFGVGDQRTLFSIGQELNDE